MEASAPAERLRADLAENASTMTTPAAPSAASPISSGNDVISHLHLDDATHPEGADHQEDSRCSQHPDSDRSGVERPQVFTTDEEQPSPDCDGQADEDPGRQPAFRAQRADLAAHLGALAH